MRKQATSNTPQTQKIVTFDNGRQLQTSIESDANGQTKSHATGPHPYARDPALDAFLRVASNGNGATGG